MKLLQKQKLLCHCLYKYCMAKIHEEIVVIKLSKLVKDDAAPVEIANEEMLSALNSVVEELAGEHIIVEVDRA